MRGELARKAALKSAVGAARFRLTGHRAPLAVTLCITRRCDSSCAGCALPLLPRAELDTVELLGLIDHLAGPDRGLSPRKNPTG